MKHINVYSSKLLLSLPSGSGVSLEAQARPAADARQAGGKGLGCSLVNNLVRL